MNNSYLSVNNLNFEYPDGFKALHNINFQIKKNERIAVLGPNGAGKTTLILHLNGILGNLDEKIKIESSSIIVFSFSTILAILSSSICVMVPLSNIIPNFFFNFLKL